MSRKAARATESTKFSGLGCPAARPGSMAAGPSRYSQRGGCSGYSPAKAAWTAFRLAPTNSRSPRRTKGRRTKRGSLNIRSSISASDRSWPASPIFFRLGLRLANIWGSPTEEARSVNSCPVNGSLKKSRSSTCTLFCKSNSLTLRQEDQRGHQYNSAVEVTSASQYPRLSCRSLGLF